jgi:hypothetical protein
MSSRFSSSIVKRGFHGERIRLTSLLTEAYGVGSPRGRRRSQAARLFRGDCSQGAEGFGMEATRPAGGHPFRGGRSQRVEE